MSFDIKQKIIRIDILLIFKTDEIVQSRPIAIQRRHFCSLYVILSYRGNHLGLIWNFALKNVQMVHKRHVNF